MAIDRSARRRGEHCCRQEHVGTPLNVLGQHAEKPPLPETEEGAVCQCLAKGFAKLERHLVRAPTNSWIEHFQSMVVGGVSEDIRPAGVAKPGRLHLVQ